MADNCFSLSYLQTALCRLWVLMLAALLTHPQSDGGASLASVLMAALVALLHKGWEEEQASHNAAVRFFSSKIFSIISFFGDGSMKVHWNFVSIHSVLPGEGS